MEYLDFSKGKIYKLTSPNTDKCYIGSTTKPLVQRYSNHVCDYLKNKNISSSFMFNKGNVIIELLELYPCANKKELLLREQFYIDNNNCCNKNDAILDKEKFKETKKIYNKTYYNNNLEKMKDNRKEKIKCDCGKIVLKNNFAKHKKTKKHKEIMENKI